ncbi:MAG: DUF6498-containing protein [Neptuniibacter sp.]
MIVKAEALYCPNCHALLSKYRTRHPKSEHTDHNLVPSENKASESNFVSTKQTYKSITPFPTFVQKDKGLWSLLAANLFTIVLAVFDSWELSMVMTIYAVQSTLIGLGMIMRMLNLKQFSTSGFKINGKPAKAVPETRGKVAGFFFLHYGTFHAVYFGFLIAQFDMMNLPWLLISICILAFAIQQGISVRDDIREDEDRKPNIGTLMTLPYARIIPMHLMIIMGGLFSGSFLGVLIFLILKTMADVLMYILELYVLYPKKNKLPG